jgi:hypothetical protein
MVDALVAGKRASSASDIGARAQELLSQALQLPQRRAEHS